MSKIVQYDNLLVNFAYFGAFIGKKKKKKCAEFGAEASAFTACRIGRCFAYFLRKKISKLSSLSQVCFSVSKCPKEN